MMKNNFPAVSIIIVNHNGYEDTKECISSLSETGYSNYSIIIIDNSDSPEQFEKLKNCYPKFEIIHTSNNGFAAANNIGIIKAIESKPEFILLLNNDTIVGKEFFTYLLAKSEEKKVGIFTPKILFNDNRELIWSAGGRISDIKADAYDYHYKESSSNVTENKYVEFSSGCCMLIRSEVFNKTGLLNEDYFLYLEDTDFCKQVTRKGYKILLIPDSIVFHKVNSSINSGDMNLSIYYNIRNRLYFAKKHFPEKFYFIKTYIWLSSLKLKLQWYKKGEHQKIKYINEAFSDFKKERFGKRNEPDHKEFIKACLFD